MLLSSNHPFFITVGARASKLSKAQVNEVLLALQVHHPQINFHEIFIETTGDKNLTISLRNLEKTDFFTKEIDEMLLEGICRIAIHSAKDLPDPLSNQLTMAALTKGIDSRDVLVLRPGDTLNTLPEKAKIATSSEKRENAVKQLRKDFFFIDIRGTIDQRLSKLDTGEIDGLVVAEAALLRLKLTHLNRIILNGETTANQGRLAILTKKMMQKWCLFLAILIITLRQNSGILRMILYLGLEIPIELSGPIIHYPIIEIIPKTFNEIEPFLRELNNYTTFIFTSKNSVRLLIDNLPSLGFSKTHLNNKKIIAIGKATANYLNFHQIHVNLIAKEETSEGIIHLLQTIDLSSDYIFWPHSSISRSILRDYLIKNRIPFQECLLYETKNKKANIPTFI